MVCLLQKACSSELGNRFLTLRSENLSLRVSNGQYVEELLNGGVGFFISGLEFAGGCMELGGLAVKQAVG